MSLINKIFYLCLYSFKNIVLINKLKLNEKDLYLTTLCFVWIAFKC